MRRLLVSCASLNRAFGAPSAQSIQTSRRRRNGGLFWLLFALVGFAFTVSAQPVNDNFANATAITGPSGSVSGSNVGATVEPGEPSLTGNPGGQSVWYV